MKIIFTFILLIFTIAVSAQEYERAIVTDVNYVRRYSDKYDSHNFPFYFHYKEFVVDIQDEIRTLVKKQFNVKEVLFLNKDSIFYVESAIAPKTEAKDYAVVTKREKTIFISVETILQDHGMVNEEQLYRFTTRVNVYNNSGKNIFKFKNHIPFITVYGDEIAGAANMGEQDFYAFYFDGLNYAFEGKYKTITKRYISKPTAEQYKEFTNAAKKFYLHTEDSGYMYGQDVGKLSEIASFTINYWESANNTFDFMNLVKVEFLDNGYAFINKLNGIEYTAKLKGGVQSLKNKFEPSADIDFQLYDADKENVGLFVYQGFNNFYGKHDGMNIQMSWKREYSCIEVYIDKQLVTLINYFGTEKVLYLSENIGRDQLTVLINSIFILDYSVALRNKMYSSDTD